MRLGRRGRRYGARCPISFLGLPSEQQPLEHHHQPGLDRHGYRPGHGHRWDGVCGRSLLPTNERCRPVGCASARRCPLCYPPTCPRQCLGPTDSGHPGHRRGACRGTRPRRGPAGSRSPSHGDQNQTGPAGRICTSGLVCRGLRNGRPGSGPRTRHVRQRNLSEGLLTRTGVNSRVYVSVLDAGIGSDQQLGDLDCVEGGSLAEVVAHRP